MGRKALGSFLLPLVVLRAILAVLTSGTMFAIATIARVTLFLFPLLLLFHHFSPFKRCVPSPVLSTPEYFFIIA
jgi:hypothetical protein